MQADDIAVRSSQDSVTIVLHYMYWSDPTRMAALSSM